MTVGTLRIRLVIRGARSLKDKRRTVKSLKDRVQHKFNASIAEVDSHETYRVAELGVAVVGNDGQYVQSVLTQITNLARTARNAELADSEMEIFSV
ncbi:MAG: DUF503 domain-containing protein [Planctomycetota bacterium]